MVTLVSLSKVGISAALTVPTIKNIARVNSISIFMMLYTGLSQHPSPRLLQVMILLNMLLMEYSHTLQIVLQLQQITLVLIHSM